MIVKNKYPFPIIYDLFDEIKEDKVFSKIELRLGYHHVRIKEEGNHKATFNIRYGHYEFTVVSFGLTNSLHTLIMCLMNSVFNKYLDKFVLIFLDDILVYSKTEKENEGHLRMVFPILMEHKLYAKLSKCEF